MKDRGGGAGDEGGVFFTFQVVLHDSPSVAADVNTRRRAEEPVGEHESSDLS